MKKLLFLLPLALFACTGTVDPDINPEDDTPTQEIPDAYTGPFTLSVDKETIEASGADWVNFSLKDAYGRDLLTDNDALSNVNIFDDDGIYLPRRSVSARMIEDGARIFTASYKGVMSNSVTVKAQNRAKYEKYHKNVSIYKATATWCGPCAVMTEALMGMSEETKDHSVQLCWHYQDDLAIYLNGSAYDCGTLLASIYGSGSVPTTVLDLYQTVTQKSSKYLNEAIWNIRADYPATCGIKLSTSYDEEASKLKVNAEMTSSTGGEYDLGVAVLLNDLIVPGGTNPGEEYSHIVVASTGNYCMYSDALEKVEKDGTKSIEQNVTLSKYSIDNLTVVAFALVKETAEDGTETVRMDNIVEVVAGESVDYHLN